MTRRRLALAAFVLVLLAVNVVVTHNALTAPYPGHNDFVTPWEAARSFWVDGVPVYSAQSNANIQTIIYGRPIEEGEFPNYFAYPFYTVFVMLPLVHLSFAWAAAVWMVVLEVCLIASLFLLLDAYRWKPRPLMLGALIVWMLFLYPSARGLILGQVSHTVFFMQVLALWAVVKGRDGMAGVALALATVKPQMAYLIVPFLLLYAARERRWRVVIAFAVTLGALLIASFVLQPTWVGDWLGEIRRYTTYTAVGSPVWVVMDYYLHLGSAGEWVVDALFYVGLLAAWFVVLVRRRDERFLWTAMLTLIVTHIVAPRTATTHFVVLAAALVFAVACLSRYGRWGWALVILVVTLVAPWQHFLATVSGEFEHPATYLPLPFGVLALHLLTRRWWYAHDAVLRIAPKE